MFLAAVPIRIACRRNVLAGGALAFATLGVALGTSGRLTYHEAFVAQSAREMIAYFGRLNGLDGPALRARIVELEKQLRRTEMEREILKKFSQYASVQMPGGLP